jgi:hypothetical protein
MAKKTHKSSKKSDNKGFAEKRTMNPPNEGGEHQHSTGDSKTFEHQDEKRRLGNFEGRGEHARTGNRGD